MSLQKLQNPYFLLTPGPLSTSPTVRQAMQFDSCTWDSDYKNIVTEIREKLLLLAECDTAEYTTVLMQGSGTFGVESVLGSTIDRDKHCVLILVNGVYGQRIVAMAKILSLPHIVYEVDENKTFAENEIDGLVRHHKNITHIMMVHCETTTGILNDLTAVGEITKKHHLYFIVDAMSSFGGIPIDMTNLKIDFLISSANKCIQGVPGFSFIICKKESLKTLCENNAKSLSLDLYGQWLEMEKDLGKWRYTSPTHAVLAFRQALRELEQEGGVKKRSVRYQENQCILSQGMLRVGFESYIKSELQSPIITTYLAPDELPGTDKKFNFNEFYQYLKDNGFVIYPGKVTNRNSFRIGTIGHVFPEDMMTFISHVEAYLTKSNNSISIA